MVKQITFILSKTATLTIQLGTVRVWDAHKKQNFNVKLTGNPPLPIQSIVFGSAPFRYFHANTLLLLKTVE